MIVSIRMTQDQIKDHLGDRGEDSMFFEKSYQKHKAPKGADCICDKPVEGRICHEYDLATRDISFPIVSIKPDHESNT